MEKKINGFVFGERHDILQFLFLKKNYFKITIFIFISIIFALIPILIINIIEDLKKYLYDEVENIADADYLFLIFENKKRKILKILHKDYKIYPYLPKKSLHVVKFSKKIYFFSSQKKKFISIGKKYLNHIKKNLSKIRKSIKPLTPEESESLKTFYGPNNFKIEKQSLLKHITNSFTEPVYMFYSLISLIFILSEEPIFGIIVFAGLSIMFALNRYQYIIEINNINSKTSETEKITVFRKENENLKKKKIESEKITVGDIIEIEDNQFINCDLLILRGECLINQSTLTGETTPILKKEFNKEKILFNNLVYSGSEIIEKRSCRVYCVVVAVGFNSFTGNMLSVLSCRNESRSLLIGQLIYFFGFFFVLFFCATSYRVFFNYLNDKPVFFNDVVFRYAQIVYTSFPFSIFFSTFLVDMISSFNLLEENIQKITKSYVSQAGRMKYICFDKTGTLTEDKMKLTHFYKKTDYFEVVDSDSKFGTGLKEQRFKELLSCCHSLIHVNDKIVGDPMEQEMFKTSGFNFMQKKISEIEEVIDKEEQLFEVQKVKQKKYEILIKPPLSFTEKHNLKKDIIYTILKYDHFDSDKKRMSVIIENPNQENIKDLKEENKEDIKEENKNNEKKYIFLQKGAPDIVTNLCSTSSLPPNYKEKIDELSQKGYRVLALAYKDIPDINLETKKIEKDMIFLGFLIFDNPLKKGVKKTIKDLLITNYKLSIITGDHLLTAINIGYQSGILPKNSNIFYGKYNSVKKEIIVNQYDNSCLNKKSNLDDSENRSIFSEIQNSLLSDSKKVHLFKIFNYIYSDYKKTKNTFLALDGQSITYIIEKYSNEKTFIKNIFSCLRIYGRTSPYQKKLIVKTLKNINKNKNYHIGFVGDGANDADALYEADIGLSIGNQFSSLVAGYFTDSDKIEYIKKLGIEGKFALQNLIDLMHMIIFFNIMKNLVIVLVSYYDYNLNSYEYILGFICTNFFFMVPFYLKSSKKKSFSMPEIELFSKPIFVTVILGLFSSFFLIIVLMIFLNYDDRYKKTDSIFNAFEKIIYDHHHFVEHKIICFAWFHILPFFIFSISSSFPYKQSLFNNYTTVAFCVLMTFYGYSMFFDDFFIFSNYRLEYFLVKFVKWPKMDFIFKMKVLSFIALYTFIVCLVHRCLIYYFIIKKAKLSHKKYKKKFLNYKMMFDVESKIN